MKPFSRVCLSFLSERTKLLSIILLSSLCFSFSFKVAYAGSGPVILTHASQVSIQGLAQLGNAIADAGYTVIPVEEPHLYTISIEESAEFLIGEIERVSREYPDQQIKIVAICNGGLLTQYILKNYPEVADKISHFASFHSAHKGTLLADLGVFLNTLSGTPPALGKFAAGFITKFNESYFYKFASEEEYLVGLDDLSGEDIWNRCVDSLGWFKCYSFFNVKMKSFFKWMFKAYGWDKDLIKYRYDELIKAFMLEAYIADKHVKFEGNEDGYDLVYKVPFYQQEHVDDPIIQDLISRPMPSHIAATNIYSCKDYIFKDYTRASLDGATNIVACDEAPIATEDHPYDEYIDLVTFHWSMYLQPEIIHRMVEALE
ncbi:MAG: hypothetical protein MI867_01665 [Pseudomonadales bacterium]|nr:hypothetical protein [Pseudomonadales bacterium]